MGLQSKVKSLVIGRGFNSLADFSNKKKVSYHSLRKLEYGEPHSIDVDFLIELCNKLDCEIGDLIILKK
jgi:DNA-binding Xre family transcriptional regulator